MPLQMIGLAKQILGLKTFQHDGGGLLEADAFGSLDDLRGGKMDEALSNSLSMTAAQARLAQATASVGRARAPYCLLSMRITP